MVGLEVGGKNNVKIIEIDEKIAKDNSYIFKYICMPH